eukprot:CAMPEP_0197703714 /NCGR_PEP_ID=MMETSP1338-20131121/125578_1 /TAXON_ID=43686 ORGANISM="Pelagodinium beii, Strain RCC1491" /NCGR_SAMPLE_ID=MMETSP1338 /ASSEMBLY_ACC=CAM_ASM_000754 /LENGTH=127 /DNA_ID=CAMNT_0043287613 /DNA_START=76 /DNA_END=460 /DNA_ORIENTATION=-
MTWLSQYPFEQEEHDNLGRSRRTSRHDIRNVRFRAADTRIAAPAVLAAADAALAEADAALAEADAAASAGSAERSHDINRGCEHPCVLRYNHPNGVILVIGMRVVSEIELSRELLTQIWLPRVDVKM